MTQIEPRMIETEDGALSLVPMKIDQLRAIARYWPMGLVADRDSPGQFGLIFQRGDQEVHGIKLQPADTAEPNANTFHHMNRALIATAIPYYLEKRHQGVMVPCAYYKKKTPGTAETGIALFVGPDERSKSASRDRSDAMYDDRLGEGATPMVFDMAFAIAKASKESGLPMMTVLGVDLRPRLAIGGLAMHFVIVGQEVIVVKDPLDETEPIWKYLVRAGLSALQYAPMRPAGLPEVPPVDTPRA